MEKEQIEPEQPETRLCLWCLVKPALPRIAYCSEECDKLAYQNTFGLKDNRLDPKGSER